MRKKRNGFTSFMNRLEGTEPRESKFYYDIDGASFSVRPRGLKYVLQGERANLWDAFTWRATPQGHDHWCDIAEGREEATEEDIEYIKWLMEEYP